MISRSGRMQRVKSKLARYADASEVIALHLAREGVVSTETRLGEFLMRLSLRRARELARRDRERPREGAQWFTADEYALVEVLADLIVPSDATSPGARHLAVQGPSAVETLDRRVAGSPSRQTLYARGLLALDQLAQDKYKCKVVGLSPENQLRLLQLVDRLHQTWSKPMSPMAKIKTKSITLYHRWSGLYPAVELFPRLVQDVLQAFYTNPVSWGWLDYDGPPMPDGYADVLDRRSPVGPPELRRSADQPAR